MRLLLRVMRIQRRSKTLQGELFLLIMMVCIIQMVLIGISFYIISSRKMLESEKNNIQQLIEIINQDVESRVRSINQSAFELVLNSEIKKNLNQENPLEVARAKAQIEGILFNPTVENSLINDIVIIDCNNTYYSTNELFNLSPDFDITNTDVFHKASEGNGKLVWLTENRIIDEYATAPFPYYAKYQKAGIYTAALIKDYGRNKDLGLLMINIKDNFFFDLYYRSNKLDEVGLYLVSGDKTKIFPIAGSPQALSDVALSLVDTTKENGLKAFHDDKAKHIVYYTLNTEMGWHFVGVSSVISMQQTILPYIQVLIIILVLSLVACLLIAWNTVKIATREIKSLVENMQKVKLGDFSVQIESHRNDEIGMLVDGFNSMIAEINNLVNTQYKLELLNKETEYLALQAQINPHFLNNTLDMLNWQLLEAKQIELSREVQALGRLFQYSMDKKNLVLLDQEVEHIKAYIKLVQARRHPCFEVEEQFSYNSSIKLPKLTLQPLVENAIIHGFGQRRNGNTLSIRIKENCTTNQVNIEITDNGIGMTEEKVLEILESPTDSAKSRIGIYNIRQRLMLQYQSEASLTIQSQLGIGTSVHISIPVQEPVYENRNN